MAEWRSDHFFMQNVLTKRDEILCKQQPGRKRSHFFNTFFVQSLFNEKDTNITLRGKYNYASVRRWGSKVPGGDIFKLKYMFCPVNLRNAHWTLAVNFMEEKRIQWYNSCGSTNHLKLEGILQFIHDEYKCKHENKFDSDSWRLVPCTRSTPRQLNGKL